VTAAVVVPLSKVQERILAEIRKFVGVHGYAPTLRELSDLSGRALASVAYQVRQLEAKGWIRRSAGQARALVVVDQPGGDA
jgi:repressor LexA